MPEVSNRRGGLFIDKKFQSKFIAVGLTTVVALAIGFFILWFSSVSNRPAAEQLGSPQGGFTPGLLLLLVFILVLVIVTVMYGLRFSHRIIGPTFALNRHLNWVREGNYSQDLRLRDGDEFQHLADTFNAMQSSLRRRVREDLESIRRLQGFVAELNRSMQEPAFNPSAAGSALEETAKELSEIRKRSENILSS